MSPMYWFCLIQRSFEILSSVKFSFESHEMVVVSRSQETKLPFSLPLVQATEPRRSVYKYRRVSTKCM